MLTASDIFSQKATTFLHNLAYNICLWKGSQASNLPLSDSDLTNKIWYHYSSSCVAARGTCPAAPYFGRDPSVLLDGGFPAPIKRNQYYKQQRNACHKNSPWKGNQRAVHSYPPGQNGRYSADDIFRCIFVNENFCILIKISLKYVPKGPIDNNPASVKIMAWCRIGGKPLSEPMLTWFIDAYIYIVKSTSVQPCT